jgi:Uncharacterized conserved protein
MISWLQTNIGSIVVVLFLLGMVALIVRRLILDKKAGKHICGGSCGSCGGGCGGCGGCPMQGQCHGK